MDKSKFFIRARFVGWETKTEETFPYLNYTSYSVLLSTSKMEWQVERRYSDFHKLHQLLEDKHLLLPDFPSKSLLKRLESVIEERMKELENYLNYLFTCFDLLNYSEILDFVGISKEQFILFGSIQKVYESPKKKKTKAHTCDSWLLQSRQRTSASSYVKSTNNASTVNEKTVISDFLENLASDLKFISRIVQEFENLLVDLSWPTFSETDVALLFFGNENVKGLFGYLDDSESYSEQAVVRLMSKLITFETNPEADFFKKVLRNFPRKFLSKIDCLKALAVGKGQMKENASMILKCLVEKQKGFEYSI